MNAPSSGSRGSILLRPKRPGAGRVNEESLDKQWTHEQRVLSDKVSERNAAERERERWGHQHEFDREEMHHKLTSERDAHLALKAQADKAARELDRELANLPGHFEHDFLASEHAGANRREEARRSMEENARLMREKLEAARAAKLADVLNDAAQADEFNERFTKPSWKEQQQYATRSTGLSAILPGE